MMTKLTIYSSIATSLVLLFITSNFLKIMNLKIGGLNARTKLNNRNETPGEAYSSTR